MNNKRIVIETLIAKRDQLISERNKMRSQFDSQIEEIEESLIILSGGQPWENKMSTPYDDESPDTIRGTEDGI